MKHLVRFVAALLLLFLLGWTGAPCAQAQVNPAGRPEPGDSTRALVKPTAAEKRSKAAADSAKRTERLFGLHLAKRNVLGVPFPGVNFTGLRLTRPAKAGVLALMLPGAGQVYNRRWWKLPLVYGSLGSVGYGLYFYQTAYREYVDGYNARLRGEEDPGRRSSQESSIEAVRRGYQHYRPNRDTFILYMGLTYGLQVLDAVVDAHLRDFDVSDDLSLHWEPTLLPVPGQVLSLPTAPGLAISLRVK